MENDLSGMALPMGDQQMAMPSPMMDDPESGIAFEELRANISPKEFSDELLASASQADPQAVAEFKAELEDMDVPPEILDLINEMVDEILANPANYPAIRQKYLSQGVTDDVLPEQFDPEFFAALNIAVDQVRGEAAGPMTFANGGIAELKPIAKALASYGRNGDTMLAHITPAEARMLKKRGGSGTINPITGLPEFFLKKLFSKIGSAVKKFVRSAVGRVVVSVALGFLLGPAAASMMGVGSAAGVAAVSGFVGGAGSTLLAGGSFRDALKVGAVGAITAGVTTGVTQGFDTAYTGSTTVGGRFDEAKAMLTPGGAAAAPAAPPPSLSQQPGLQVLPGSEPPQVGLLPNQQAAAGAAPGAAPSAAPQGPFGLLPDRPLTAAETTRLQQGFVAQGTPPPPVFAAPPAAAPGGGAPSVPAVAPPVAPSPYSLISAPPTAADLIGTNTPTGSAAAGNIAKGFAQAGTAAADTAPGLFDKATNLYKEYISPSGIEAKALPGAEAAGLKAANDRAAALASSNMSQGAKDALIKQAYDKAFNAAMPGVSKYLPMAALGLGAIGAAGGFKSSPAQQSPLSPLFTGGPGSATNLLASNPNQYYVQFLPGVGYTLGKPNFAGGGIVDLPGFAQGGAAERSDQIEGEGSDVLAPPPGNTSTTNARVLTNEQKYALADVLTKAQQSGDYSPFSAELQRLGLTQADLLYNFPNINLQGIQEHSGRGVVAPMYQGDVATGVRGITEGQRTDLGNRFMQAQQTGNYAEFNDLLKRYQLQPSDLTRLYPNLTQQGVQQYQKEQPTVTFPEVKPITPVPLVGTPANTQIEVASPTLRGTTRPSDPGSEALRQYLAQVGPGAKIESIVSAMDRAGVTPGQVADVMNMGYAPVQAEYYKAKNAMILGNYDVDPLTGQRIPLPAPGGTPVVTPPSTGYSAIAAAPTPFGMNTGGIADLAGGGYPRRTGQIDGPGTETSDSIPAMLSDGEFVMTARAVRGAGNGSRREGAKKMYALMHRLEKNAARS